MDLQARADHLAQLIEDKLDVRGQGLEAKLHRAGRLLPKYIRGEADYLVEALKLQASPKLARQVDLARLRRGVADVERYLRDIDPWVRRRAVALSWLAANAFNLLVVAVLLLAVLLWRGFL